VRIVGDEFVEAFLQRYEGNELVRSSGSSDPYFRLLEHRFPVVGSKIDWERVPNDVVRVTDPTDSERYARDATTLLTEIVQAERLSDEQQVIVIGDSAVERALVVPMRVFQESLNWFLELPQHLSVIRDDGSWCFSFTMEGDLAFGRAPASERPSGNE
jgi:hypothetical protein